MYFWLWSSFERRPLTLIVYSGDPATASPRLQFCQSWNGVASFVGPLIASDAFFSGSNNNNLTNVQYVYLAVACAGVAVGVVFFFAKLPEIEESAVRRGSVITEETLEVVSQACDKSIDLVFMLNYHRVSINTET